MDVYLHIGSPKTGTSSIQGFFSKNRKELFLEHNIIYPNKIGDFSLINVIENHNGLLNDNLNILLKKYEKTDKAIVLSCEAFFLNEWQPKFFKQIFSQFEIKNFKIICFLKRQDLYIESAWKQWWSKDNRYSSINEFSQKVNFDWNFPIKNWFNYFDKDNFVVLPFEKEIIGDNIVYFFCNILKIYDSKFDYNFYYNKGYDKSVINMIEIINKDFKSVHDNAPFKFLNKYLSDELIKRDTFSSYGILSNDLRATILNRYLDNNIELNILVNGAKNNFFSNYEVNVLQYDSEEDKLQDSIYVLFDILKNIEKKIIDLELKINKEKSNSLFNSIKNRFRGIR
jgi:hypothetical protein